MNTAQKIAKLATMRDPDKLAALVSEVLADLETRIVKLEEDTVKVTTRSGIEGI